MVEGTHDAIESEIAEVVAEHERAWNAHDADRLIAMFEDPMDFVNVLGMHHRSAAALRQEYQRIHATFMKNSVIGMRLHDARRLSEEIAVAHAHWEMSGMEKLPGWNAPEVRRGVMTYVLVRRGEKWKITAAHNTDVVEMMKK
ncbi:MAG TPA: SgcJ/EcaC family oxidoreductase [Terriglobales bacterium]|nr:SgcJ/EcaC family oxidoreductase [Terriglobales bacterium]